MPRSVIVATTVLILMMVLRLVSVLLPAAFMLLLGEVDVETAYAVVGSLLSLGFGALLVAGFFTGHRLAWQWGRLVVIFAVYGTILVPYTATRYGPIAAAIEFSVSPLPLFVVFFSLGRESARKYFRLRCPECQAFTVKAADFLFNRARCRACNASWTSSAQLDPIAEDVNSSKWFAPAIVVGLVVAASVITILARTEPLSPTESRLETLLESSAESAEGIASDDVDYRRVTRRCIRRTRAATAYCSRQIVRDPSVEGHPDGEDWVIQWRLDFVRPDRWHVSQEAWDPELGMLYDEWVTVGETNFENAGLWSQGEVGLHDELNRHLLVDGLLVALEGGEPASSGVISVEGTRYLLLAYDQATWIAPCSELLADTENGRCEVEVWIDLETDFLAKGVYRLENEEGYFEIHHAFASYNEDVVVEPPPWLNLEPDENGNLVVTREDVPVLEHHP